MLNTEYINYLILNFLPPLLVLFFCLPIHEFAHGFVADKLGDPTPRRDGRLTLNPFVHLDLLGSICLLLGGFGWAKPVIINPFNLRNRKSNMALVAIAGPVANLLMMFAFAGLTKLTMLFLPLTETWAGVVSAMLRFIAIINLNLAIFNLIPIPPLDGSKILYFFLPNRIVYKIQNHERQISIAFLIIILCSRFVLPFGFFDLLGIIINPIWNGVCVLFGL